ncbi:MAG TPA: hypothetical protein VD926_12340 [Acidimicrobiales bacterium]|nr:hypothetical protein [Acidimicrobiales bacterium]
MRMRTFVAAALGTALLLVGCNDDGGSASDDTDPTEDTEPAAPDVTDAGDTESTTTTSAVASDAFVVEDSPVAGTLEEAYGAPDADPIVEPGTAGVQWYAGAGTWVAVFIGLDLEGLGPLCPGTSVETGPGTFLHVSNTPTEDGACEGFTNPEATVRRCGEVLVYETLIPLDVEGTLYGSVERAADGGIEGITSRAEADPGQAPDIDPQAPAYDSPAGVFECE